MQAKEFTKLEVPGPNARSLIARDRAVVSPAYGRAADLVMSHGKGSEVWDVDGNRFLDFAAGIAVNSTGHSHPQVVRAIQQQAERFLHISCDYFHEPWIRLSEQLAKTRPFAEEAIVFLGNSGTEAVEGAIKAARYHTGRHRFIGFMGGFHGRTHGALSFTASKAANQRRGFAPYSDVTHIPYPNAYRPVLAQQPGDEDYGETVVNYLEEVVFKTIVPANDVAGILIEPIQGEGGYLVPPSSFFPLLRALCDRHGIVLIADEVQSGVGRTGKWWAMEHWGVEPDIVCTAKGIASGVPLGGFFGRKSVMTLPTGTHGSTYGGNPIACAAALATLDILEREGLQNATTQGNYMLDALQEIATRHPIIGQVRGIGLMIGVEFVKPHGASHHHPPPPAPDLRNTIEQLAFEHGLLMIGCGTSSIRIAPSLLISRSEVDEGLAIFEHVIGLAERE